MSDKYSIVILAIDERQSDGKWDWAVLVTNRYTGLTLADKVSGGRGTAEGVADRLIADFEAGPDEKPAIWEKLNPAQ